MLISRKRSRIEVSLGLISFTDLPADILQYIQDHRREKKDQDQEQPREQLVLSNRTRLGASI